MISTLLKYLPVILFITGIGCTEQSSEPRLVPIESEDIENVKEELNRSKALLINVWATWCGPCVEEFPHIVGLKNKYDKDLNVMFISADFMKDTVRVTSFLEKQNVDWDTYLKTGSEYDFINAVHSEWSGALPFTVIYDKEGKEVTHWENKADSVIFERYIKEAINR